MARRRPKKSAVLVEKRHNIKLERMDLPEKDVRGTYECTDEGSDGEERYNQALANSGKVTSRHVSRNPALGEAKQEVIH